MKETPPDPTENTDPLHDESDAGDVLDPFGGDPDEPDPDLDPRGNNRYWGSCGSCNGGEILVYLGELSVDEVEELDCEPDEVGSAPCPACSGSGNASDERLCPTCGGRDWDCHVCGGTGLSIHWPYESLDDRPWNLALWMPESSH